MSLPSLIDSGSSLPQLQTASSIISHESEKEVNLDYKTGAKFVGKFQNYKKSGKGVFIWPNGAKYDGEYCNNFRQGKGIQVWPDGSCYEGDFDCDLRHGDGYVKWSNGETYRGDFFKDCRHGQGVYSWPDGSSYTGKFYMNRKEGYGVFKLANGNVFEGLYRNDERLGPGVMTYPSKTQDVGLWAGEKLMRLCSQSEGAFTMMDHQQFNFDPRTSCMYIDMSECDNRITSFHDILRPPSIFDYLPDSNIIEKVNSLFIEELDIRSVAVNREAFDRQFFKETVENVGEENEKEEKTSFLAWNKTPTMIEMQKHTYKHRRQAKEVTFGVEQICSGDRSGFANKGPLELGSEKLLKAAQDGDIQTVEELLNSGLIDPDVSDNNGHTALIGATVHWHIDIINILLNHGADVNHLNDEGSSALSAGTIFYYNIDSFSSNVATFCEISLPAPMKLDQKRDDMPRFSVFSNGNRRISNDVAQPKLQEDLNSSHRIGFKTGNGAATPTNATVDNLITKHDSRVNMYTSANSSALKLDQGEFNSNASLLNIAETQQHVSATPLAVSVTPLADPVMTTERLFTQYSNRQEQMKNTLVLLLQRGADPNASGVPMPVLIFAVKAADVEMVQLLLMKGAATNTKLPVESGSLTPLHIAVSLKGEEGIQITELLLDALADPDARGELDNSYLDETLIEEWIKDVISSESQALLGGRTPLMIACSRIDDYQHASKVVHLLLTHKAKTSLLCNGFSPLALAIASGNDLAVDLLLAFGADASLTLTHGVGNALCVASSTKYESCRTIQARINLIDKLVKFGADILAPVPVNPKRQIGTAVDYAYYVYNMDRRIAHMPFHSLTVAEREVYNSRRELLAHLADILRTKAVERERLRLEEETKMGNRSVSPSQGFLCTGAGASLVERGKTQFEGSVRKPLFKYCYECGRSVGVRLSPCTRCKEVYYCSKACKIKAWNIRHKEECVRVAGKTISTSQSLVWQDNESPAREDDREPDSSKENRRAAKKCKKKSAAEVSDDGMEEREGRGRSKKPKDSKKEKKIKKGKEDKSRDRSKSAGRKRPESPTIPKWMENLPDNAIIDNYSNV